MKRIKPVLLVSALFISGPTFAATNLLTNGDFESSDSLVAPGGYTTVYAGSPSSIFGWSVGGTSVDLIEDGYGSISNVSIDLAGSPGPGSISQSFSTIAGYTYTLDFDMGSNGSNTALLSFGNLSGVTVTLTTVPTHFTYSFTASSAGSSLLTFASTGGVTNNGAVIDNVSVTAVPEPETYAMMLAGLGLVGLQLRRKSKVTSQIAVN